MPTSQAGVNQAQAYLEEVQKSLKLEKEALLREHLNGDRDSNVPWVRCKNSVTDRKPDQELL